MPTQMNYYPRKVSGTEAFTGDMMSRKLQAGISIMDTRSMLKYDKTLSQSSEVI